MDGHRTGDRRRGDRRDRDLATRGRIRRAFCAGTREVGAREQVDDRAGARCAGQSAHARKRALSRSAVGSGRPHKKCKSGIRAIRAVLAHAAREQSRGFRRRCRADHGSRDRTASARAIDAIPAHAAAVDPARPRQHRIDQDRAGQPARFRRRFTRSRRDVDGGRIAIAETRVALARWQSRPHCRRDFLLRSARHGERHVRLENPARPTRLRIARHKQRRQERARRHPTCAADDAVAQRHRRHARQQFSVDGDAACAEVRSAQTHRQRHAANHCARSERQRRSRARQSHRHARTQHAHRCARSAAIRTRWQETHDRHRAHPFARSARRTRRERNGATRRRSDRR